jgi:hypothetical protein
MGEHRLKIFKNRVLRRPFGPNTEDVMTGGWKKLHNKELLIPKLRMNEMSGTSSMHIRKNINKILVRKSDIRPILDRRIIF